MLKQNLYTKYNFKSAWTNQCFEYWIYLHFEYSDSALHRDDWINKLDRIFKERVPLSKGYKKNNKNLFCDLVSYGSLKHAVANAKRIESKYRKGLKCSQCDPGTAVHHLIFELSNYIEDLP